MNTKNKFLAGKNDITNIQQGVNHGIAEFLSDKQTDTEPKVKKLMDCIEKEISCKDNRSAIITFIQEVIEAKKVTIKRSEGFWLKLNVNNASELEQILNILLEKP